MVEVRLERVTKRFGRVVAVDEVTLSIRDGELFTLLGPSGCGKTTVLRIIAGLELPDSGRVYFGDRDVTFMKAYERRAVMVFQNYALWPHMKIYDNVAFGLRLMRLGRGEISKRVREALEMVRLEGFEDRYPNQLSGGEQQRVALARALAVEPEVLLLDEPLSNLDAKLRVEMREELRRLQKEFKITSIYVTHDQEEALSISDRVAVMNRGRIHQVGTPLEVYEEPIDPFVASFIGRASTIYGIMTGVEEGLAVVDSGGMRFKGRLLEKVPEGSRVVAIFRPEDFTFGQEAEGLNMFEGVVDTVIFLGAHFHIRVQVDGVELLARVEPRMVPEKGSKIKLSIDPDQVKVLPTPNKS
ncbi:ABC transporter ATP-binding protein [Candidatus Bathyarchaeota archaeon]|nr:ABC transporter ATP-binding protein [Candidatus Bathyarchaeota archaeon]